MRNREKVPHDQVVKLDELLAANRALLTVYLLKDDLKQMWRYRREAWARWGMLGALETPGPAQWAGTTEGLRPLTGAPFVRHLCPLPLAVGHQPGRRHQQQDLGHQAHGIRLP